MRTSEKLIVDAGDLGSLFVSEPIDVYYMTSFAVQFYWTGNPDGVLKIQSTNKESKITRWHDVPESNIILTGNPGEFLLEVKTCSFRKMRVKYEPNSGSGNLWCEFIGKGR